MIEIRDDLEELEPAQQREVERIDAGGDAWEGSAPLPEARRPHFKRPMEKVIPVRLSDEHWRALRAEAARQGIGPTTLLRMWAIEKLGGRRSA